MKNDILNALKNVIDPDLNKDIVSLNFVKEVLVEGTNAKVTIELTTPACPVKTYLKASRRSNTFCNRHREL